MEVLMDYDVMYKNLENNIERKTTTQEAQT